MNFQELGIFTRIVKLGSITKTADELNLAKSAVSASLSKLEDRLSVKLLIRSSRKISLTEEGRHLLPRIESLLEEGERLVYEAELETTQPAGVVTIALAPDFGSLVMSDLIPKVFKLYPELRIISKFSYGFEDLQDNTFDFAVRINKINDENLVSRYLGCFRRILVATPEFLKENPVNNLKQLSQVNCLLFNSHAHNDVWMLEDQNSSKLKQLPVKVKGNFSAHNLNVLSNLVKQGQGVGFIPEFLVQQSIQNKDLIHCLPNLVSKELKIFLCYRSGTERINRVKTVLDLAEQEIPKLIQQLKVLGNH